PMSRSTKSAIHSRSLSFAGSCRGSTIAHFGPTGPDVQHQVIERDTHGEKVREHTDGVVLAEDEIREQQPAARNAPRPEDARHRRLAVLARGGELEHPATRKEQHPQIADELPRREHYAK